MASLTGELLTNLDENHVLINKVMSRMTKKSFWLRQRLTEKLAVTDTNYLWQKKMSWKDTDCLRQPHTVCNRHILSLTDKQILWQTATICDSHRLSVTETDCLWQTQTVCDRFRLSVTDTDCLWQTHTVCDKHRLSVTDRNCLSQI